MTASQIFHDAHVGADGLRSCLVYNSHRKAEVEFIPGANGVVVRVVFDSLSPGKILRLLNHFVGAGDDGCGQVETQRLGDAEIDPEVELGGSFERQVAWLCAP